MESLWRAAMGSVQAGADDYDGVEFWGPSERAGWLTKQGEYIKTWRRPLVRSLKQGKVFWFKESMVTRASRPRGVIPGGPFASPSCHFIGFWDNCRSFKMKGYVSHLGSFNLATHLSIIYSCIFVFFFYFFYRMNNIS
ncbi:pleckstrin homology domain-containing protein 1 [Phtheirospermum japonicum]|uniref:Pleckstrin homology domain-containing protein 1 n=1 Tax=Phtheirospermum japonicum TaxID=374723 RepID=A0A830BCV5_9LAMI|nr:pleckstrin homology domain-containing protein 1 [Phtheirospermum japonicum]